MKFLIEIDLPDQEPVEGVQTQLQVMQQLLIDNGKFFNEMLLKRTISQGKDFSLASIYQAREIMYSKMKLTQVDEHE